MNTPKCEPCEGQPRGCICYSEDWPYGWNTICDEFTRTKDGDDWCAHCDHKEACHASGQAPDNSDAVSY